jgi:hypothetical protein
MHKAVFDKVVAFFMEQEAFCGESIMQCDAPQIAAPEFLSDLADTATAEANARLITLAPDLIEFVEEVATDDLDRVSGGLKMRAQGLLADARAQSHKSTAPES